MAVVAVPGRTGDYIVDGLIRIKTTFRQGIILKHDVTGQVITLAAGRDMGITQIAYDALVSSYGATVAPAISRAQQMINDGEIS